MITGTGNGNIQYNKPYLIETRKIKYKGPGEVGNEKKKDRNRDKCDICHIKGHKTLRKAILEGKQGKQEVVIQVSR